MAIPQSPQQLTHRQRVILRVCVLAGLVSSALALLLWTGVIPVAAPATECPPAAAASGPSCEPCGTAPASSGTPAAAVTATDPAPVPAVDGPVAAAPAARPTAPATVDRYSVCEAASGNPLVRSLRLAPNAPPAVGVHCGNRIEIVAFDHIAPRRIATLETTNQPNALPGGLVATDLTGDGAIDLVAGVHKRDEQASPRGGALYEIRRTPSGGFAEARPIAPLTVADVLAFELDGTKGSDLAVLQLQDARLGRANEVVLLRGGPAPVKLAALRAGIGMDLVAAVDLDLDAHPDLVLAGAGRPTEVVYLDARGAPRKRSAIDPAPASVLAVLDFDRDGHDDLWLGGSASRVVLASGTEPHTPFPLQSLHDVEHLQAIDWDGDGKLDLIGQRGRSLVLLVPHTAREVELRELATWPDQEFVLRTIVDGPRSGLWELVLIASPVQARGRVELWRVSTLPLRTESSPLVPVPDAPLVQRMSLP